MCKAVAVRSLVVSGWVDDAGIQRHDRARGCFPSQPEAVACQGVLDSRRCYLHSEAQPPLAQPGGQQASWCPAALLAEGRAAGLSTRHTCSSASSVEGSTQGDKSAAGGSAAAAAAAAAPSGCTLLLAPVAASSPDRLAGSLEVLDATSGPCSFPGSVQTAPDARQAGTICMPGGAVPLQAWGRLQPAAGRAPPLRCAESELAGVQQRPPVDPAGAGKLVCAQCNGCTQSPALTSWSSCEALCAMSAASSPCCRPAGCWRSAPVQTVY